MSRYWRSQLSLARDFNDRRRIIPKRPAIWAPISMFAILISGCVTHPEPEPSPVTDPTHRYHGVGFSALPPQGEGWFLRYEGRHGLIFRKELSKEDSSGESEYTFVMSVFVENLKGLRITTAEDFPLAAKEMLMTGLTGGHYRVLRIETSHYGPKGSYCARYNIVREKRKSRLGLGVELELTSRGFVCIGQSSRFTLRAVYGEIRPKGRPSKLEQLLKEEGEEFLRNVKVTRLEW